MKRRNKKDDLQKQGTVNSEIIIFASVHDNKGFIFSMTQGIGKVLVLRVTPECEDNLA